MWHIIVKIWLDTSRHNLPPGHRNRGSSQYIDVEAPEAPDIRQETDDSDAISPSSSSSSEEELLSSSDSDDDNNLVHHQAEQDALALFYDWCTASASIYWLSSSIRQTLTTQGMYVWRAACTGPAGWSWGAFQGRLKPKYEIAPGTKFPDSRPRTSVSLLNCM